MSATYPKDLLITSRPRVVRATCFVLMPFAPEFDAVYKEIQRTLQSPELNFLCRRADDFRSPRILETILSSICRAEFVLADLTELNPNVFYELGIAHCIKDADKVIILTQDIDLVPFDLRHLRCIVYGQDTSGLLALRRELAATLEEASKTSFRFRILEGKKFEFGRKLVGRRNNMFSLTVECVHIGCGAVKIIIHLTEHSLDDDVGPAETRFLFLSDDQPSVRINHTPWVLHLAECSDRDALLVLAVTSGD